jgi:SAM-dependent methyltransferase
MNRLIRASDNDIYQKEFAHMEGYANEMMKRKIFSSLHQSAQILHYIMKYATKNSLILSAGSYDDMPTEALQNMGYNVTGVDPVVNVDLNAYRGMHPGIRFDVIFSTSVIEHVQDDEQFIEDICNMLKPGGKAFITCDFKPGYVVGDRLPATCIRFYTEKRLEQLAEVVKANNCELVGIPQWNITDEDLDFQWEGIDYCFVGMSFRRSI